MFILLLLVILAVPSFAADTKPDPAITKITLTGNKRDRETQKLQYEALMRCCPQAFSRPLVEKYQDKVRQLKNVEVKEEIPAEIEDSVAIRQSKDLKKLGNLEKRKRSKKRLEDAPAKKKRKNERGGQSIIPSFTISGASLEDAFDGIVASLWNEYLNMNNEDISHFLLSEEKFKEYAFILLEHLNRRASRLKIKSVSKLPLDKKSVESEAYHALDCNKPTVLKYDSKFVQFLFGQGYIKFDDYSGEELYDVTYDLRKLLGY